jgi:hypothetical protein
MINSKITKQAEKQTTEEKVLKLLESIDWKLWEMYKVVKETFPAPTGTATPEEKPSKKAKANATEE